MTSHLPIHRRRRDVGFTLIELVMAMAACAIVLAAIYGVFSKAVHLRDNAIERTKIARLRLHAANMIRKDLANAIVSGGTLAATLTGSRQGGEGGFPGYLKFTTTTGHDGQVDGVADVQEVEYYIAADKESSDRRSGVLVRTVERALLAPNREQPAEERILSGVESMEVTFYDGGDWKDSWEVTDDDKTLPKAVRVRVLVSREKSGNETPLPMEIVVPWMTQATTEETTTAQGGGPQ
jgi:type II secretion system protein J